MVEAHVEATTTGSMVLAGLLLKLGIYGMARFLVQLMPQMVYEHRYLLVALPLFAAVSASFSVFLQNDLKRFIAYTSIAHMNFSLIGLFSATTEGITGALLYSFAHGFSSMALFCIVGCIYDRFKTRNILYFSGLSLTHPRLSFLFFALSLANLAFPGTMNFISEFLILLGMVNFSIPIMIIASSCIFLSAAYSFVLYNKIFLGAPKSFGYENSEDLTDVEVFAISFFFIGILLYGVFDYTRVSGFVDAFATNVCSQISKK